MTAPLALTSPIEAVPGVGPRVGEHFRALGIISIAHLINHLPFRHSREEAEDDIESLPIGAEVTARGEITATRPVRGRRPRFQAVLVDHTGRIDVVWFNQFHLHKSIHPGMTLRVQGKLTKRGPSLEMVNPRWEILPDEGPDPDRREARLRPVYPASEDLSTRTIEKAIDQVLDDVLPLIEDHFDAETRRAKELPELAEAYRMIHRPADEHEATEARRRLAYDELFLLQLALAVRREELARTRSSPEILVSDPIDERIRSRLPFELTASQNAVVAEINADLARTVPMNRLLQGDVGSGKTAVAVYAMLAAVARGHQAALMAPTEVLAEQHFAVLTSMLRDAQARVELLVGSMPAPDRAAATERIASGDADLIIGTHALIAGGVTFASLGVAIIDEQHRFGIRQRLAIRQRAGDERSLPHTLVMTATPIPRTLAATAFGDLDVSVIRHRPEGRGEVFTRLASPAQREELDAFIRERLEQDDRIFVVVPAVEQGSSDLPSVEQTVERLATGPCRGFAVAALHGRMPARERQDRMDDFRAGRAQVLVATTVIEVGVDVPAATVMVIEGADRFGLAQIHQLRGRVGRGARSGVCVLVSDAQTPAAVDRLNAAVKIADGFALAEKDLELRGPGDMLGPKQSGLPPFRVAALPGDEALLQMARRDARDLAADSPHLDRPEDRLLARRMRKAHSQWMDLAEPG